MPTHSNESFFFRMENSRNFWTANVILASGDHHFEQERIFHNEDDLQRSLPEVLDGELFFLHTCTSLNYNRGVLYLRKRNAKCEGSHWGNNGIRRPSLQLKVSEFYRHSEPYHTAFGLGIIILLKRARRARRAKRARKARRARRARASIFCFNSFAGWTGRCWTYAPMRVLFPPGPGYGVFLCWSELLLIPIIAVPNY